MPKRTMLTIFVMFAAMLACGDDGNDLPCDERRTHAYEMIDSALNENLSCKVDKDCTTVNIDTDCSSTCLVAVSKDGLQVVKDVVIQVNDDYCQGYQKDDCTVLAGDCGPQVPTCTNNGECVMAIP